MNIKTTKDKLSRAIASASRAIPQKATNPIMENFLLKGEDGYLSVTATDGDTVIVAFCEAEAEGGACINAKTLTDIVRLLPDGDVTITTDGKQATIYWPSGRSSVPAYDTADFPDVNFKDAPESIIKLNAGTFADAMEHVIPHVASDILRPQLTGVHFNPTEKGFDVVASDSHTICIVPVEAQSPNRAFTVAPKGIHAIMGAIAEDEEISIEVHDGRIYFGSDSVRISSREIVGKYPAYERIIPTTGENTFGANIKNFVASVRRVAVFSNKSSNHIRLDLAPLGCEVSAQDIGFGTTAKEELEADYDGQEMAIGFKYDLLLKSVGGLNGDAFQMQLNGSNKAVLITSESDSCKTVIMPVQIK